MLGNCDVNNPSAISKEQILRWENEGTIKYLGVFSDVREIIALCDCVVLPSYKEGMPRIMLEALALGKAIITTNTAGCKECVELPLTKKR
ncbi:glycosyltransferase [Helicobacter sp. 23-1045]